MNKPFHELTDEEYQAILDLNITYEQLNEMHPQPEWCGYPHALSGLGCWSLTSRTIKCRTDCVDCDEYKGIK